MCDVCFMCFTHVFMNFIEDYIHSIYAGYYSFCIGVYIFYI